MIVTIAEAKKISGLAGLDDQRVKDKLDALELAIRSHTHNNFQNRSVRFFTGSDGNRLHTVHPYLRVGDTVQISQTGVNDGLYCITEVGDGYIIVDKELYTVFSNLVTKVEYPADIKQGVLNLLQWEVENRKKVGIKQETLSRHSVTYYDQDANNQVMGYPVSLMGFLRPYIKARF